MDMILSNVADILLIAATLGAGVFCLVLSRRLTRLSRIDNGLGGAIAVLSAQVDDMSKALTETKSGSQSSATRLEEVNAEAQLLLEELELMLSACHDVDAPPAPASEARTETPAAEADWNVFDDLISDNDPAQAAWQEAAAHDAKPMIKLGARRAVAEDSSQAAIPLFLKSKSPLASIG